MFALQLEKLLRRARSVLIGVPKEGKEEGGISLDILEDLLSKCALFVCNKWDVVQEVELVKDDVVKKLKRAWSCIDPESQITTCQPQELLPLKTLVLSPETFPF